MNGRLGRSISPEAHFLYTTRCYCVGPIGNLGLQLDWPSTEKDYLHGRSSMAPCEGNSTDLRQSEFAAPGDASAIMLHAASVGDSPIEIEILPLKDDLSFRPSPLPYTKLELQGDGDDGRILTLTMRLYAYLGGL